MTLVWWQFLLLLLFGAPAPAQPYILRGVAKAAQTTAHTAVKLAGKEKPAPPHSLLPDSKLTPGAIRTTDAHEICSASFRTKKYRVATQATKKEVCAEYGVKDCPKKNAMELDDLVSLELGGENVKANLWVQFAPEYHWKDLLENRLHALVCMQKTLAQQNADLVQAQEEIRTDWVKAYEKYIGPLPVQ
jgi:hypothetical protein